MLSDPSEPGGGIVFSVVVPVYRNRATLVELIECLEGIADRLARPLEAVFVVDGSPDDSFAILAARLPGARIASQLLTHSRNFGAFAAIRTGIEAARGEYIGVMAADLQEPPELMLDFFAELAENRADVAIGRRESRDDPALSSMTARLYWRLYRKYVIPEIPPGGVDVFAINAKVAREVRRLRESHSSLVGLLYWVGFRRAEIPYVRRRRESGRSSWTLKKKLRYMSDSVFSFTDLPVRALTIVGAVGTVATTIAGLVVLLARLTGNVDSTGYTPLMLAVLLAAFVVLFGLGVVGSYVWRIYENSKSRPNAIVASWDSFT